MTTLLLDKSLEKTLEKLAKRMRERLRVGGDTVTKTLTKARMDLPRRHRAEVDHMLEALQMATHPKLSRQIDQARIERAAQDIMEHLKTVNIGRDRERRVFDIALTVFMNLAGVAILLVAFLAWKGLL